MAAARPRSGLPYTAAGVGFLVLVAVWCGLGALLGTHRTVVAVLGRLSHWLVPVVFLAIGALVLTTTGALALITGA